MIDLQNMNIFVIHFLLKNQFMVSKNLAINVENSYIFILIWGKFCDFKFTNNSVESFRIHIWLTLILTYVVTQYVLSFSFQAINISVRSNSVEQSLDEQRTFVLGVL